MSKSYFKGALGFLTTIFILMLPLSLAQSDTQEILDISQNNYELGKGFFNENLDTGSVISAPVNDPEFISFVADLDNDTVNEIIVIDDEYITVYHISNSALTPLDDFRFNVQNGAETFSNAIVYDIDGDGTREVFWVRHQDDGFFIVSFNGTDLVNESNGYSFAGLDADSGAIHQIACRDFEDCVVLSTNGGSSGQPAIRAQGFNSTNISSQGATTVSTLTATGGSLFGLIKAVEVEDLDNDGDDEYIFNYLMVDDQAGQDEEFHLVAIEENANDVFTTRYDIEIDAGQDLTSIDSRHKIVPPLCADFTNSLLGIECVVLVTQDEDEYELRSYSKDGVIHRIHPDPILSLGQGGVGTSYGNLVKGSFFDDTSDDSFCGMGYDDEDAEIDFICGRMGQSISDSTRMYDQDEGEDRYQLDFNVSDSDPRHNIFSAQHSEQISPNGVDKHEIVTPYGIFRLGSTCSALDSVFQCDVEPIFPNSLGTSAFVVSVDAKRFGLDDLIFTTDTNIFYYEDGVENQPATIASLSYNPCIIDNTVKVNSSVVVTAIVQDNNLASLGFDKVNAIGQFYKGQSFEQSVNYTNVTVSSSTGKATLTFSFVANVTGTYVDGFKLSVWDNGVPSSVDERTASLLVSTVGVEFGDTTCSEDFEAVTGEEEEDELLASSDNLLKKSASEANDYLGIGLIGVWLLVMLIINVLTVVYVGRYVRGIPSSHLVGVIIILDFLWILLGAVTGIIPVWVILTVIVVSIGVIVVWFNKHYQGQGVV